MNTSTLKLIHPIEGSEGTETTELKFRRPKAKDIRGVDLENLDMDGVVAICKKIIVGEPPMLVDEIDLADLVPLAELVADFLEGGPTTGKTT